VALVALAGCRSPALPVLGTVPPFDLTERSSSRFTQDDVRGKVWVADFIFTRCPDVCPLLTTRMRGLQDTLGREQAAVELVSFSVDPTYDTPEVLQAYASAHSAGPGWRFVTGPRDAVASLLRDGFHVAFADDGPPTGPITHSDRFVLVDPALRIRGYYHGSDPDDLRRLAHDAADLAANPRG
jgi:protein SCO1/2